MSFLPGTQLYKYELQYRIGSGGFGDVWLARDHHIDKDVAVKILDQSMHPVTTALREAQVGNRLNHQNVVKIHYADTVSNGTDQFALIAMDFHSFGSITNLRNAGNFVTVPKAIPAVIDVLRGLEYLHEQDIFHNDIKPSNILIGEHSQALLTDYGISCHSPGLAPASAPNAYVLHRAPETGRTNVISVTTDVYQVGLTLFRLINGIGLIENIRSRVGDVEFERLKVEGKILLPKDYVPFIGNDIKRVISKATNCDPAHRFQSALDMRRALERVSWSGYWDVSPSGTLLGISGNNKYDFEVTATGSNYSFTAFKTNTISGRRTKVSSFSHLGLTKPAVAQKKAKFLQAVVKGEI